MARSIRKLCKARLDSGTPLAVEFEFHPRDPLEIVNITFHTPDEGEVVWETSREMIATVFEQGQAGFDDLRLTFVSHEICIRVQTPDDGTANVFVLAYELAEFYQAIRQVVPKPMESVIDKTLTRILDEGK